MRNWITVLLILTGITIMMNGQEMTPGLERIFIQTLGGILLLIGLDQRYILR